MAARTIIGCARTFSNWPTVAWVAVAVTFSAGTARAQNTWTGGGADGNWGTTGNWTAASPANNFSSGLVFAGSTFLSNTNTLTGGTATSITFDAGAGAFTLGGNAITLGGTIANNSTNLQTINLNMTTSAVRTLTLTAGGGNLALGGNLSGGGGYTLGGTGTATLSGSNSYTGRTTLGPGTTLRLTGANALVAGGTIAHVNTAGTYAIQFAAGASMSSTTSVIDFTTNTTPSTTGTLTLDGFNQTFASLRMGQKNVFNITSTSGAPTFTVTGTTFIGSTNSASVSGTLAPTGGVNVVLNSVYSETPSGGTTRTNTLVLDGTTSGNQINGGLFDVATNSSTNAAIGITKQGAGTWTLSGSSGYTGPTTVSGGVLAVSGAGTLGASGSSAVTLSGGRLDLGSTSQTVGAVAISAASAGNTLQGGSLNATSYSITNTAGTVTVTTSLAGAGGLAKTGAGTLVLQGTNSYAGATTVRGALTINSGGAITGGGGVTLGASATPSGTFNYNTTASSTLGAIIIGNGNDGGGNATFNQTAGSTAGSSLILNNSFTGAGAGDLNLSGGSMSISGNAIASNSVASATPVYSTITVSGTATLTIGGSLSLTGAPIADRNGWGRVTQSGGTVTVGNGLNMAQTTVSNTNTRNGEYNLNGGTLNVGLIRQDAGVDTTGTFNFNSGTLAATASTATFMQGLTTANVQSGGAVIDSGTFSITIAQNLRGAGGTDGGLRKFGAGSLVLSGSNTYSGTTTVNAGTLQFAGQTALYGGTTANWTASRINVRNGGTLALSVGGTGEFTTGNVTTLLTNLASSTSGSTGMNAGSAFAFDTTNAAGGTFTIADVIANSTGASGGVRSLTKLGSGTLVLSGSNTYSGTTTVSAGVLAVNGSLGTGPVSVAAAAWLQGTGTIAGTATVLGTLSPGSSPGVLTLGSVVLGGSSTTLIEIDGVTRGTQYDGVTITGTSNSLTYGGLLSLNFGALSPNGTTYDIFNFAGGYLGNYSTVTSTGAYAGTWDNLGSGTFQFVSGGQTLTFSQSTGDIIVVPEPAAVALVGMGLGLAGWAVRRRALRTATLS